jgi:hypothetical protein
VNTGLWSLHPIVLIETVLPHLFGDFFRAPLSELPWMAPLNSGREPFFFSLYLGPAALLVAVVGILARGRTRWRLFWLAVGLAGGVCALGAYSPVYPALLHAIPPLQTFRFPAKYLLFTVWSLAVFAALGWQAWHECPSGRDARSVRPAHAAIVLAVVAGLVAYGLLLYRITFPHETAVALQRLAVSLGAGNGISAVAFMFTSYPPAAARFVLLALIGAGLLWIAWSRRPEARRAGLVLCGLIVVDLLSVNSAMNPTTNVANMGPPAWAGPVIEQPSERFYFGGRPRGYVNPLDVHGPKWWTAAADLSVVESRGPATTQVALTPGAWGMRELLSYDLPLLWPVEWELMASRFQKASGEDRLRFLARLGVRYCVLPDPPSHGQKPLALVPYFGTHALYECPTPVRRVLVVGTAVVLPGAMAQVDRLFDPAPLDTTGTVLIGSPAPPPSGREGTPEPASARIQSETTTAVTIEATVDAGGGFLVFLDSFHPSWRARVDGEPAQILRANGLFRAVAIAPGRHVVRFEYRPRPLLFGAVATACAGAVLLGAAVWPGVRGGVRRRRDTNCHSD